MKCSRMYLYIISILSMNLIYAMEQKPIIKEARIKFYKEKVLEGKIWYYERKQYPNQANDIAINFNINDKDNRAYVADISKNYATLVNHKTVMCRYLDDHPRYDDYGSYIDQDAKYCKYLIPYYKDMMKDWEKVKSLHQDILNKIPETTHIIDVTADLNA